MEPASSKPLRLAPIDFSREGKGRWISLAARETSLRMRAAPHDPSIPSRTLETVCSTAILAYGVGSGKKAAGRRLIWGEIGDASAWRRKARGGTNGGQPVSMSGDTVGVEAVAKRREGTQGEFPVAFGSRSLRPARSGIASKRGRRRVVSSRQASGDAFTNLLTSTPASRRIARSVPAAMSRL